MLDTYPNLKYLSRDRGKQYQALSNDYEHIADRFHLIKNLSDLIIKEMKNLLPIRIKLNISAEEVTVTPTISEESLKLSNSAEKKLKLVKEIRK